MSSGPLPLSCYLCKEVAEHFCSDCDQPYCDDHHNRIHQLNVNLTHRVNAVHPIVTSTEIGSWPFSSNFNRSALKIVKSCVLIIDWASYEFGLGSKDLSMFVSAHVEHLRSIGIEKVLELVVAFDPKGDNQELRRATTCKVGALDYLSAKNVDLSWEHVCDESGKITEMRLTEPSISLLRYRSFYGENTNCGFGSSGPLVALSSSRPHRFKPILDEWLERGRQVFLFHGHGQSPSEADPRTLSFRREPNNIQWPYVMKRTLSDRVVLKEAPEEESFPVGDKLLMTGPYPHDSPCASWIERTCASIFYTVMKIWGMGSSEEVQPVLSKHLASIVGISCIWDTSVWREYMVKCHAESVTDVKVCCPLWNSGIIPESSLCVKGEECIHKCSGCGGPHPLTVCVGNKLLTSSPSASYDTFSSPKLLELQHWTFKMLDDHRQRAVRVQEERDGDITPWGAMIFMDWQNIKTPDHQVENMLKGVCRHALSIGATYIKRMYIFVEGNGAFAARDQMEALRGEMPYIDVISVLSKKPQAVDTVIQRMMAREVKPARPGVNRADLVVLVSGDSDFCVDLATLALLGHRTSLIYSQQTGFDTKACALWYRAIDYLFLPDLRGYTASLKQFREERKKGSYTALARGIAISVRSLKPSEGDFGSRCPGLSGMCMDFDGSSLLLVDAIDYRMWRLKLNEPKVQGDVKRSQVDPSTEIEEGQLDLLMDFGGGNGLKPSSSAVGFRRSIRPTEVVSDHILKRIYICDTSNRRIMVVDGFDRTHIHEVSDRSRPQLEGSLAPKDLCLDSKSKRLWFTDGPTGDLYYYLFLVDASITNGVLPAILTSVKMTAGEDETVNGWCVGSKCVSADGKSLIFCDTRNSAFCELSFDGTGRAVVTTLTSWVSRNVGEDIPKPLYHSLLLDRDGTYIFADARTHTVKRLSAVNGKWRISVMAGQGQGGFKDGSAVDSRFKFPGVITIDPRGTRSFLILETDVSRIRKLFIDRDVVRTDTDSYSYKARTLLKSKFCRFYQDGTCDFMSDSDRCSHKHECSICTGPHGSHSCSYKTFLDENPCIVDSQDSRETKRKEAVPKYVCTSCRSVIGPISQAKAHLDSHASLVNSCTIDLPHSSGLVSEDRSSASSGSFQEIGAASDGIEVMDEISPISHRAAPVGSSSPASIYQSSLAARFPSGSTLSVRYISEIHPVVEAKKNTVTLLPTQPSSFVASIPSSNRPSCAPYNPNPQSVELRDYTRLNNEAHISFEKSQPILLQFKGQVENPSLKPLDGFHSTDSSTEETHSPSSSPLLGDPGCSDHTYACELCKKRFNSASQLDQHNSGRSHISKARGTMFSMQSEDVDRFSTTCERCNKEFEPEPRNGDDRRPLRLACNHVCCRGCMVILLAQGYRKCPGCSAPSSVDLDSMPIDEQSLKNVMEQRVRSQVAEEKAKRFQEQYPFLKLLPIRHGKQPCYHCTICDLLLGPVHRAISHINLPVHNTK